MFKFETRIRTKFIRHNFLELIKAILDMLNVMYPTFTFLTKTPHKNSEFTNLMKHLLKLEKGQFFSVLMKMYTC